MLFSSAPSNSDTTMSIIIFDITIRTTKFVPISKILNKKNQYILQSFCYISTDESNLLKINYLSTERNSLNQ